MTGKYNPFRPDKTAPPGMFAGRVEELKYINSCLFQTKNGNPKHFLIAGERGIGKSSLVLVEQMAARGRLVMPGTKHKFNFIVTSIKLRKEDSFVDIVRRVATSLKKDISNRDGFANFVLKSLDILSKIEAAGVRYHRDSGSAENNEAFSSLMDDLESAVLKMGDSVDGILILIDEADAPPSESGLGLFCKLLTEEMATRQTDRICIGLAGLPHITNRLVESHESSLRIFHSLNLKPLEPKEQIQVLELGIEEAKKKNSEPVTLTKGATELICDFSEEYPHFLQEFAYCAFEKDEDNIIDIEDFLDSLFMENGAFDQLGVKYFNRPYNAPGSDDYRKVLHVMAESQDDWTARAEIITASGLKGGTVDNALRALKNRNIILQEEARMGRYRLPTRSFATWINIQKKAAERANGENE